MVLNRLGAGNLGTLIVSIDTDLRNLDKGLKDGTKKVEDTSRRISQSTERAIVGFSKLGLALAGVGALLAKQAIDFESAFAGVRKTVDATEKEFGQLRTGLIELSREIPVSAKQLAGIQEIAGQLGIKGVKNLTQFTESIAKIAVTTNLTREAAAIGFARIAAVIGEPIENINEMASVVVDLGNKFEVVESEIITFAQRIAGMGKIANLTVDEILAIGAAFASVGIQAEAGGTAVNKVLLELQKQGKTGIGAFTDFVQNLEEQGPKAAIVLEELGFKQARTQRAFLSLAGAGGKLTEALQIANVAFEEGNALNEEADKRFSTTASRIELTKNNVVALAIELGEKLLPAVENILISVNFVTDAISKLSRELSALTTGVREASNSLEADLTRRIELIDQEIEKNRQIIDQALGNATARAEAEQRINDLLVHRSRTLTTLLDLRRQEAEEISLETIKVEAEGSPEEDAAEVEKGLKLIDALKELFFTKEIKRIQKLKTENKSRAEIEKQLAIDAVGTLQSTLAKAASLNRGAAIAFKAIQIGRAIIGTASAVAEALPNIPLAIAVGAIGAAEIATIAATPFVKGSDNVPVRGVTDPGEIVVTRTFADAIRQGRLTLGGPDKAGGGAVSTQSLIIENIEINVQGSIDEDIIPELVDQIGTQLGTQTESLSRGAT